MTLDNVKDFLEAFETCVIATVGSSQRPEAATVGFSVDDDFKFVIASNQSTRKAQNIAENDQVALVVGFDGSQTLQLEGNAIPLDEKDDADRIQLHFNKVPGARKYADESGQKYYLITPTWLRFTDYTQADPIFETKELA